MSTSGHVAKKVDKRGRRRWYPVLELPRGEDDRRRQRWLAGHDTKKAAEQALREVLGAADKGIYVEPSKETTGTYLIEWLSTIRTTVRPTTLASYESLMLCHVVRRLGHVPLKDLGPAQLNRLYGELLTNGRRSKAGGRAEHANRSLHAHRAAPGVEGRRALGQARPQPG